MTELNDGFARVGKVDVMEIWLLKRLKAMIQDVVFDGITSQRQTQSKMAAP